MKNRMYLIVAAVFIVLLLASCWSYPEVERPRTVEDGVYTVRLSTYAYRGEDHFKYAIGNFVRSKGHDSYDAELIRSPNPPFQRYFEYRITVPGSTPVEDIPKKSVRIYEHLSL